MGEKSRRVVSLICVAAVGLMFCAGCTSTSKKGPRLGTDRGDALIFGRFQFYVNVPGKVTGTVSRDLQVCIGEYKPPKGRLHEQKRPGPSRERWVRTDQTGYYEMTGGKLDHGYRVTRVKEPVNNQTITVDFPLCPRPDGRVLNLGTMVCKINADGSTDIKFRDPNIYTPSNDLVKYALDKHEGDGWDTILKRRYVLQRMETGQ